MQASWASIAQPPICTDLLPPHDGHWASFRARRHARWAYWDGQFDLQENDTNKQIIMPELPSHLYDWLPCERYRGPVSYGEPAYTVTGFAPARTPIRLATITPGLRSRNFFFRRRKNANSSAGLRPI